MNTTTTVVLITLSSLSLITSSATLVIVLIGAKQMQDEIEEMKVKTNKTIRNFKSALENMEI